MDKLEAPLFQPRTGRLSFEVLRHRLWQINDEQGQTVINVSGSPVASAANDFNVAITNAQGLPVMVGIYNVGHLMPIAMCVQNAIKFFGEENIQEGDIYLTNDPWMGAAHQNDTCLMAPVHWEGRLLAWVGSVIHEVDVGGPEVGSWNPNATTAFEEAPRYLYLKVVSRGAVQKEVVETYLANSRLPHLLEMDLRAQIAACNVAKGRLFELIRRYGVDTVTDLMQDCMDYSESLLRHKLDGIPNGRWTAEDYMDHDGHREGLFKVQVALEKTSEGLAFDFTGTSPQVPGFINCALPCLWTGVFTSVCFCLCNDIPWNAGILKVTRLVAPEASLVSARFPAPVGAGVVNASRHGRNACTLAIAKMLACSEEHRQNLVAVTVGSSCIYNTFGTNQYGKPFGTMMMSSTLGGGGARYFGDGYDTCGASPAGRQSVINVEEAEALFPLLYLYRKRAVDSGGPGKFRGGVAGESAITAYNTSAIRTVWSTQATGHSTGQGVEGGYPGGGANARFKTGTDVLERLTSGRLPAAIEGLAGDLRYLPSKDVFELRPGDVLTTVAPGGGGFGDPLERDPALVQQDVVNGFVSASNACDIYGVELDPNTLEINQAATAKTRGTLRSRRLPAGAPRVRAGPVAETPKSGQRLGDGLLLRGDGVFCRRCHCRLANATDNPRAGCLQVHEPLSKAGPWVAKRHNGDSPVFHLREYFCPGCASLLFVDERLKTEPEPWRDYQLT